MSGGGQSVLLELFEVELNCLADQGGNLLSGFRCCDTTGELEDMGSVAGGPLFDHDGVIHQALVVSRAACLKMCLEKEACYLLPSRPVWTS